MKGGGDMNATVLAFTDNGLIQRFQTKKTATTECLLCDKEGTTEKGIMAICDPCAKSKTTVCCVCGAVHKIRHTAAEIHKAIAYASFVDGDSDNQVVGTIVSACHKCDPNEEKEKVDHINVIMR
jgi:hypothetical protein